MRSNSKLGNYCIPTIIMLTIVSLTLPSLRLLDRQKPTTTDIEAITLGMPKEKVIQSLGAVYDGVVPGEYEETDRRLKERGLLNSTTYVQYYPIRDTRLRGLIVYNNNHLVSAVWIE